MCNLEVDHFGELLYFYLPDNDVLNIETCSKASIVNKIILLSGIGLTPNYICLLIQFAGLTI